MGCAGLRNKYPSQDTWNTQLSRFPLISRKRRIRMAASSQWPAGCVSHRLDYPARYTRPESHGSKMNSERCNLTCFSHILSCGRLGVTALCTIRTGGVCKASADPPRSVSQPTAQLTRFPCRVIIDDTVLHSLLKQTGTGPIATAITILTEASADVI